MSHIRALPTYVDRRIALVGDSVSEQRNIWPFD